MYGINGNCLYITNRNLGADAKHVNYIALGESHEGKDPRPTHLKINGGTLSTSDYRLKSDVCNIEEFTVLQLRPVHYDMYGSRHIGLIAHEVQEHIPMIVFGDKDGKEMQYLNYIELIPVLIKDIQRLHKQNTEQESRIAKLESQISYLMNRLA